VWAALAQAGVTGAAGALPLTPRAARLAAAVLDLAAAVPLDDPQDERLTDALAALRAKFKAAAAAVGPDLAAVGGSGGGGGGVGSGGAGGGGGPGRLDF
jgi:hypothetical protein